MQSNSTTARSAVDH